LPLELLPLWMLSVQHVQRQLVGSSQGRDSSPSRTFGRRRAC
jgi:hypothetical protein